ncbi:MAG TPA: hypothetical protein VM325_18900 [Alphaproteobacteria bacterium]|nr:hypothetical protein [Alphaproteobacteria bacterium]
MSAASLERRRRSQRDRLEHARLLVETLGYHGAVDWCLRNGRDGVLRALRDGARETPPVRAIRPRPTS